MMHSASDMRLRNVYSTAFTAPTRCPELWYISPPKRHICALVTGGLKKLYDDIKNKQKYLNNVDDNLDTSMLLQKQDGPNENMTTYDDEYGNTRFVPWQKMPLLAGRYRFISVVGSGQTAIVISAQDTFFRAEKLVIIKILNSDHYIVGGQEADLLRDVHLSNSLNGAAAASVTVVPSIIRLLNLFHFGDHYCLVFEPLNPTPLITIFNQRGLMGMKSIVGLKKVAINILNALCFLHGKNIIHADVKPENILLIDANKNGNLDLRLVDFGNAIRNTLDEIALYETDYEIQTLIYRAPEVILGAEINFPIDLWSVGCILAELYLGKPLFAGETKDDVLSSMCHILGPLPASLSKGKFADKYKCFIGQPLSLREVSDNLGHYLRCTDSVFVNFLASLLNVNSGSRLTSSDAITDEFLRPPY